MIVARRYLSEGDRGLLNYAHLFAVLCYYLVRDDLDVCGHLHGVLLPDIQTKLSVLVLSEGIDGAVF